MSKAPRLERSPFPFPCARVIIALLGMSICASAVAQSSYGEFQGKVVLEAIGKANREFIVREPLIYIDRNGTRWEVPIGTVSDGASVPRAFWSIFPAVGGRHLKAAVVHDRYCVTRDREWRAVHSMFYEAMLASEVDAISAKIMYMAVFAFGPRWALEGAGSRDLPNSISEEEQEQALKSLKSWIEKNNPSIRQIEARVETQQVRQTGGRFLIDE